MNVLVTGSAGFVGNNIIENLKNFRDGKNRTRPNLQIEDIYEYDKNDTIEQLDEYCRHADWVVNLAGINRPKDPEEFYSGNFSFAFTLLETLKKYKNTCPVMFSSSLQATLAGRFEKSEYGKSKLAGEELFFSYAAETGAEVLVYRYPNIVGKFIRPNYNSVVGTFCYNYAHDLPITVNDPNVELEMLFIEDLMEELWDAMEGIPHRCEYPAQHEVIDGIEYDGLTPRPTDTGRYCYAPVTHKAVLGQIVELLNKFKTHPQTRLIPDLTNGCFEKKLYSMYLSYLPKEKTIYNLHMNIDERGNFTELVHTSSAGQVSVNISKSGITRGRHWHNSKTEEFIVVSGRARIRERKIGTNKIEEYEVSGEKIQSVIMKPGFTHEITNIGDADLVTVIICNEVFDPNNPDTFYEPI